MLSKCANPICVAPFRYLREGRIFNVEIRQGDNYGSMKIEHYWLCESCAKTLKVVLEEGVVSTPPLRLALPAGTVEEVARQKKSAA